MNILITGGTGFVGSHMIDFILKNETDVKIFATKRWMEDTKNVEHIDDDRFEFSAFEINEVPQCVLIANALLEKMCE